MSSLARLEVATMSLFREFAKRLSHVRCVLQYNRVIISIIYVFGETDSGRRGSSTEQVHNIVGTPCLIVACDVVR